MGLSINPLDAVFGVAGKIIERVWPDPAQQAEAARKMAELRQSGELDFMRGELAWLTGQIETNKIEAQHGGLFKGGWRPFVGWTCGLALAYHYIVRDLIVSVVQIVAHFTGAEPFPVELLPQLDMATLMTILVGMLGIGTMRTIEKQQARRSTF